MLSKEEISKIIKEYNSVVEQIQNIRDIRSSMYIQLKKKHTKIHKVYVIAVEINKILAAIKDLDGLAAETNSNTKFR